MSSRNNAEQKEVAVPITATVHEKGALFFRVAGAEATDPATGEVFDCCIQVGAGSPIIGMPDGRTVTFSWQTLIAAARAALTGA